MALYGGVKQGFTMLCFEESKFRRGDYIRPVRCSCLSYRDFLYLNVTTLILIGESIRTREVTISVEIVGCACLRWLQMGPFNNTFLQLIFLYILYKNGYLLFMKIA